MQVTGCVFKDHQLFWLFYALMVCFTFNYIGSDCKMGLGYFKLQMLFSVLDQLVVENGTEPQQAVFRFGYRLPMILLLLGDQGAV